jgi:hypothetical protein
MPQESAAWNLALKNLSGKVGQVFKEGTYELVAIDDRAVTFRRTATGKDVRVSRALVERTYERLAAGDEIDFRAISYTVAVEYGVLLALEGFVTADEEARSYRARGRARKKPVQQEGKFRGLAIGLLPLLFLVAA